MMGQLSKDELRKALGDRLYGSSVLFLSPIDENDVNDVVADAFKDDPMMKWVAGLEEDDAEKEKKMTSLECFLFKFINHRIMSGKRGIALGVRGQHELIGCATVVPSSCSKEGMFDDIISIIKFGLPPMYKSKREFCPTSGQRLECLTVLRKMRRKNMNDVKRWIHVQTIGVRCDHHGKGHGKRMLELLNRTADSLRVPLYLETHSQSKEAMYKRFGYRTVENVNLQVAGDKSSTANFTMYLMRRDPH